MKKMHPLPSGDSRLAGSYLATILVGDQGRLSRMLGASRTVGLVLFASGLLAAIDPIFKGVFLLVCCGI